MRDRHWLKRVRERLELTQSEFSDLTGLSLDLVKSLELGRRKGTLETWDLIEEKIEQFTHEVTLIDKQGHAHHMVIQGDDKPIFDMLKTATDCGEDIGKVLEYIKSMQALWQEIVDHQIAVMQSSEAMPSDENCYRAIKQIAYDNLKLSELERYFEEWLGISKQ